MSRTAEISVVQNISELALQSESVQEACRRKISIPNCKSIKSVNHTLSLFIGLLQNT